MSESFRRDGERKACAVFFVQNIAQAFRDDLVKAQALHVIGM